MSILYDFIFVIFSLIYFPYLLINRKFHKGFWLRLGNFSFDLADEFKSSKNIWIHAVSVGEVLAVLGLYEKIKNKYPDFRVVLSTVTQTGNKLAQEKLKDNDIVIYAPLDFSFIVNKFIKIIQPKIYISAETEIWPNLYSALKNKNVPIIQVNGRISEKAFKGYKKLGFLMARVFSCVNIFCVQSEIDAERVKSLGVDKSKVKICGNLKFDITLNNEFVNAKDLGFSFDDLIFLAGSTHLGEEEILIDVLVKLRKDFPGVRLVIAPRHIERIDDIKYLVEQKGFVCEKFSQITSKEKDFNTIVVVDTIGHLRSLYSMANIVFIGKTLRGVGGQNMIEPAYFGKPIFVGPHTENFKDVVELFLKDGAIVQVPDEGELFSVISELLSNQVKLDALGQRAKRVVEKSQGATIQTLKEIQGLLLDLK